MQSKVVRTLALTLVLSGMSIVLGQPPTQPPGVGDKGGKEPPAWGKGGFASGKAPQKVSAPPVEKSKLEQMLAEALKNNPDIRVAGAKLAEAEAELNRTRLQVTQKVVTLYYAIEAQKKAVEYAEKRDKRVEQAGSVITQLEKDEMRQTLALAKAKLDELEAQLPALLGKVAHLDVSADLERISVAHALRYISQPQDLTENYNFFLSKAVANPPKATGPSAERLRKALQMSINVEFNDMTFDAILNEMSRTIGGLTFRNLFDRHNNTEKRKLTLQFKDALPVSAVLQALSDETGCLFFVRDYGIVATTVNGAPTGAMTVEEFLRHKTGDESRPQSRGGKNPPAENVEGLVKSVDVSGLMRISIGSDAGLAKGHTLELFRLNPSSPSQSKYLGTVRILEVEAHQSVAQPVGGLTRPPQKGDRIASRLQSK